MSPEHLVTLLWAVGKLSSQVQEQDVCLWRVLNVTALLSAVLEALRRTDVVHAGF